MVAAFEALPRLDRRPVRQRRVRRGRRLAVVKIVLACIQIVCFREVVARKRRFQSIGCACRGGGIVLRFNRRRVLVAIKQRISLELLLDIGGELEIGELQQLDGLLQLGRHHQGLPLAKLKSLG